MIMAMLVVVVGFGRSVWMGGGVHAKRNLRINY